MVELDLVSLSVQWYSTPVITEYIMQFKETVVLVFIVNMQF